MPKEAKQKAKLLYIWEALLKYTDENNCMSSQQLIDYLAERDITVERKTIFSDIATLKDFGADIVLSRSKDRKGYYVASRDFELPELKVITEAILSSRYITAKKSKELISKLESLVGPSERKQLDREVFVSGRVKSENESIYYNVDILHNAILDNRQITFNYLEWTVEKELALRHGGKLYRVSPWALTVKDENYYLVAYDESYSEIRHYRVDKMKNIKEIGRSKRKGLEEFERFDVGRYTTQNFGMFRGQMDVVAISLPEDKIGIFFDRFGKDIDVRKLPDNRVSVRVSVYVSNQFFGWLTGLGEGFTITMPQDVKTQYVDFLRSIVSTYSEKE
ncbi:MAG: WYL domain-containing protein [Lachnospiraceae bacterium]|nr:WYL domain-containing protein [Lachnospiraceae bacterium]